ncbi:MAG: BON domain-containing protein [Acidobacteriaceae bacterium]|nr:BON domain-containing protein [Acidobacteriaceae bacterium]
MKLFLMLCIFMLFGSALFLWSFASKFEESPTDVTIQSDLQPRLHSFSQANGSPLKVLVSHGTVRLEGTVTDQYEHEAILEIAKQGSGTDKIEDQLKTMLPPSSTQTGSYRYQAWLSKRSPRNDSTTMAGD